MNALEDINLLYQKFLEHPQLSVIQKLLQQGNVYAKGLAGSSVSFLLAAFAKSNNIPLLVVANNKEEAAFLYTDITNFISQSETFFFPSSYKRSVQFDQTLPEAIIQRTDTIGALTALNSNPDTPQIIVTYPDALFEKISSIDFLKKKSLSIKTGEKLSPDFTSEVLLEYSFEKVDFVYEPGQFSRRGSIIDIFSYSSSLPYRIDFFGDEVESIRTFDIENQLSKDIVESAFIIPNVQALATEQMQVMPSQLPQNTVVWIKNMELVLEKVSELQALLTEEQITSEKFADGKEIFNSLKPFKTVTFGLRPYGQNFETVDFGTSPQPAFNKNFELLANNISENSLKGYHTYFLAENPSQHERIKNILQNIDPDLNFTPISFSIHEGFVDHNLRICLYTDHQLFDRYDKFKLKHEFSRRDALSMQELINLQVGDYVVHIDHGIGVFGGLVSTEVNGKKQEAIRLNYQDNDTLLVSIHNLHKISKYRGKDAESPKIYKLGSGAWQKLKTKTKSKIKDIAKELIALYAKRKAQQGFAFSPDTYLQQELEASFVFEDTPDQEKATKAVKEDMELNRPMDRLVCGDVGFGKTEVAIRAAFKAVTDSKQVAVLVPTTILALQHYRTFTSRLKNFPCTVEFINRMKTSAQQKEIKEKLAEGKIDIIVGTHSLLSKSIKFKDLGLLVVDEEQKFGVSAKEKLKMLKLNVDTLTLTATPIPRTLQFSLMGARDLSIINTPPPNRHPIYTELHTFNTTIIKEAIEYEVTRGGQVFFVHNRVQNILEVQTMIHKISPKIKTAIAHGQMDPNELERTILEFINGDYDVLISTAIIESGLDIPNANTMIINNAQMFGLSDLHQLRGRVGRSNKKAFCYLLAPPMETLTNDARRRLKAIEEFSELGSGFSIAMQDLDIRGAGNLLGGEQSGFISEIGFETYQRILDEAIEELKESEFKDLFQEESAKKQLEWKPINGDCHIETDMEIVIPSDYVSNTAERIRLYRELDNVKNMDELNVIKNQLIDRFGELPQPVKDLLLIVELRWLALELGFEKLIIKNDTLTGHFITNQLSPFYRSKIFEKIINYIQSHPSEFKLKEIRDKLILSTNGITSVEKALNAIKKMHENVMFEVNNKLQ